MGSLRVISKVVGSIQTNCYFIINSDTSETVIVDAGAGADLIIQTVNDNRLKPAAVVLTHGHFDHILAVDDIRKMYSVQVYAGRKEEELIQDVSLNLSADFGCPCTVTPDVFADDKEVLELAGFRLEVVETPGHTQGSVCYYMPEEGVLFSGDTLFNGGVGRTDFPTGSSRMLISSLKERIAVLPDATVVYPGHGEPTQIGWETENNPYMI